MLCKKICRAAVTLLLVAAVAAAMFFSKYKENTTCMGVDILSEKDMARYTEYVQQDLGSQFFHNGEMAAVDVNTFTIYISQDISAQTHFTRLTGKLKTANPSLKLAFAPDEYFDKLDAAVAENHPFRLIVSDGGSTYMEYYVVFTTLPVVSMNGTEAFVNEENRQVYSGDICVWTPLDPQTGSYTVKTSQLEWHVRGDSQKAQPKKPYKLALKGAKGQNNNLDLLGLGEDDDWILNSMSLEDLEFRDKLVMDLWNEMCTDTPYNPKMDSGEYVEVVYNGSYSGLYLLQRRIDTKYLSVDSGSVLLKGRKEFADPSNPQYYTVVGTSSLEQQAVEIMQQYDLQQNYQYIDIDNWIDVNLFCDWGYMPDNIKKHNMYYLLEDLQDDLKIKLILWDTDMAFGLNWNVDRYSYNLWIVDHLRSTRPEYEKLKELYPDLDSRISQRWKELRSSVLSKENILEKAESYQQLFAESGAFARDKAKWGSYHGGADTIEVFYDYIDRRLEFLDGCYLEQ